MKEYIISRYNTYADGRSLLRARLIPPPIDANLVKLPRLFTQSCHYTFIAYLPEGFLAGSVVEIADDLISVTHADYQVEIVSIEDGRYIVQRRN